MPKIDTATPTRPAIRFRPIGIKAAKPTPRKKPALTTRTCEVCADRFQARRHDARYCGNTCAARASRGSIPETVQIEATAKRDKRAETKRKAKEERDAAKARREVILEEKRIQFESEAPLRAKWIAHIEKTMDDQIASDPPQYTEELLRVKAEQLEIARTRPVPPMMRKVLEGLS